MLFLGLIVAVIILAINNNKLSKQVDEYKNILRKHGLLKNETVAPVEEVPPKVQEQQEEVKEEVIETKVEEEKPIVKEKQKYSDKEIKNSSILITGSILVVLSALIFLTTTWDVTDDILKALMLFIMLGVFYGASVIAKKINLNQTYKAFHYITLAYIPISLLSLCVFELIGDYFSISCEGCTIYLGFCSLLVSAIYYLDARNKDSKFIGILSILFLLAGVTFFDIKLEVNFATYVFSIGLVAVIFTLLHKLQRFYINESINKIGYYIMTFGLIPMMFISSVLVYIFSDITVMYVVNAVILTYLVFYLCFASKHMNVFNVVCPLLIMFTFLNISGLVEQVSLRELIMLASFVVICFYEMKVFSHINNVTYYLLAGASFLLWLFTAVEGSIPSYMVLVVFLGITLLNYLNDKKTYKLYYVSVFSYLTLASILNYYDLSTLFFGYIVLIAIAVSMSYKCEPFRNVGYIFMFMFTFAFDYDNILASLLLGLFTLLTFIYSINKKDLFNRIVSYIYFNVTALYILLFIEMASTGDYFLVVPVCGIFIYMFELLLREDNVTINKVLLYVDYGLSAFILICLNNKILHLLLIILHTLLFCYHCYINKENKKYVYVPFFVAIPFIYYGEMFIYNGFNYMNLVSLASILGLLYMMYKMKEDKYTVFYFVYVFLHACAFEDNKYLLLLLVALCGLINFFEREGKTKDAYKALLYGCGLTLTQFLASDWGFDHIAIFVYGLYMVFVMLITRNILKKYMKDYKVIEYIGLVFVNLLAIFNFYSELDGLIFIIYLVFWVIISYVKKWGPAFLISLIFIIVNFIRLTKEFWLSLPWWLYILIIGSVLIIFAVINELKDKNKTKNDVKLIKKLKDTLDL